MKYYCSKCGKEVDVTTYKPRCECGGLWKLKFEVPRFDLKLIDKSTWSVFRYRAFMPLLDESWQDVSMGEGMTPIIPFDEELLLKMDYMMPTLSFKDRGAAVLISHCKSIGVKSVIQDSSGNAGNSVAAYCAKAGIGCEIFVPKGTSPQKINMIRVYGSTVNIVDGSRDHCADVCREKVKREGKYYASHVYNPFFFEGTKTYIYEIYEQLHRIPQNIFIPLGNGTLFLGAMRALEEFLEAGIIECMPNVVIIQSECCMPIIKAIEQNSRVPDEIKLHETLAEGIAIGKPMRGEEILDYIYKYNLKSVYAPEDKILEARNMLAKRGIYCEHTTAASYAAYRHYCALYGKTPDSIISMCGAGLKSEH